MSDPSPYVLASVPSTSSDPRLLTLHLEICRMRAELENLEARIERIRVSEVEAASDTRPFVDRAQELVDRTVAALLESGRTEIALAGTESRVRAAARLEAANRQAQELLSSAREELAAVLTERAESVGDLSDLGESDRTVLADDGLMLLPAASAVDVDTEPAGPEMVDHHVDLEEFPGWDAGFGMAGTLVGSTDAWSPAPEVVAGVAPEIAPALETPEALGTDVVPDAVDDLTQPVADPWPAVHEHVAPAPDPVTTNRYDELWGIAAGVGVDDPATPTPEPATHPGDAIEAAVGLDPSVTGTPEAAPFGSETWTPIDLPTEASAPAVADDDIASPVAGPDITEPAEASALADTELSPAEAPAAPVESYPPPAAYPPPVEAVAPVAPTAPTSASGVETARADAAFDVWLAMNPKAAATPTELPVQPEPTRGRWVRPVEIIGALLLVAIIVIVLLLFVG